jgi:hypothetical protein
MCAGAGLAAGDGRCEGAYARCSREGKKARLAQNYGRPALETCDVGTREGAAALGAPLEGGWWTYRAKEFASSGGVGGSNSSAGRAGLSAPGEAERQQDACGERRGHRTKWRSHEFVHFVDVALKLCRPIGKTLMGHEAFSARGRMARSPPRARRATSPPTVSGGRAERPAGPAIAGPYARELRVAPSQEIRAKSDCRSGSTSWARSCASFSSARAEGEQ